MLESARPLIVVVIALLAVIVPTGFAMLYLAWFSERFPSDQDEDGFSS